MWVSSYAATMYSVYISVYKAGRSGCQRAAQRGVVWLLKRRVLEPFRATKMAGPGSSLCKVWGKQMGGGRRDDAHSQSVSQSVSHMCISAREPTSAGFLMFCR
jgi:hypothetical protein